MKTLIDRLFLFVIATLAAALILVHFTPAFAHGGQPMPVALETEHDGFQATSRRKP